MAKLTNENQRFVDGRVPIMGPLGRSGSVGWHYVPPYAYAVLYVLDREGCPVYESRPLDPPGDSLASYEAACVAIADRIECSIRNESGPSAWTKVIAQLRIEKDPSLASVILERRRSLGLPDRP